MAISATPRDPADPPFVGGARAPGADGADGGADGMASLRLALSAARRRWPFMILAFLIGFAAALAAFFLLSFPYVSTATLLVEPREQRMVTPGSEVVGQQPQDAAAIESQVQIFASPSFLKKAADALRRSHPDLSERLGAKRYPGPVQQSESDAEALGKSLKARRRGLTYMIDVTMTSRDPAFSAEVANLAADLFMNELSATRSDLAGETSEWLSARVAEMRDKVIAADKATADFKAKNNLIDAGQGSSLVEREITDLVSQLGAAKTRSADAKARLDQIERAPPGDGSTLYDALQSQALVTLRAKKSEALRALAEQQSILGERHPTILSLRSQVVDFSRQIDAELARVRASLRNEFVIARGREQSLERQLARLRDVSGAAGGANVQLRELEREAQAMRQLYEQYLGRQKQAQDQRGLRKNEIRLVSPATPALATTRPGMAAIVPVCLAAGLVAAFIPLLWGAGATPAAGARTPARRPRDEDELAADLAGQAARAEREAALALARAQAELGRAELERAGWERAAIRRARAQASDEERSRNDSLAANEADVWEAPVSGRARSKRARTAERPPAEPPAARQPRRGRHRPTPASPTRSAAAERAASDPAPTDLQDLARLARGASVVLVTALERKVGRSATARALAHVFAREGRRALLVSFDPDPAERPGLVDAVLDDADPLTLIRRDSRGLDVLGSGLAPGDPDAADLARRPELGDLLDEALEDYQVIVVDGPRLSLGGREAAAQADVVVLLAGRGALGEASRQADALSRALERPVLACAPPRLGGKNAA